MRAKRQHPKPIIGPLPSGRRLTPPAAAPSARGYGPDWYRISQRVRQRDRWTCQECGWQAYGPYKRFLHAHHIVPRAQGGLDHADNLTSLCVQCHAQKPHHAHLKGVDYHAFRALRQATAEPLPARAAASAPVRPVRGPERDGLELGHGRFVRADAVDRVPADLPTASVAALSDGTPVPAASKDPRPPRPAAGPGCGCSPFGWLAFGALALLLAGYFL